MQLQDSYRKNPASYWEDLQVNHDLQKQTPQKYEKLQLVAHIGDIMNLGIARCVKWHP